MVFRKKKTGNKRGVEHGKLTPKTRQRDNLLNTVNQMAALLLATHYEDDMMSSVFAGMELLGRALDIDRVQIWKNEIIDLELQFVLK